MKMTILFSILSAGLFLNATSANACMKPPDVISVDGSTFEKNEITVSNSSGVVYFKIDDSLLKFSVSKQCWEYYKSMNDATGSCLGAGKSLDISQKGNSSVKSAKLIIDKENDSIMKIYSVQSSGQLDMKKPMLEVKADAVAGVVAKEDIVKCLSRDSDKSKCGSLNDPKILDLSISASENGAPIGEYRSTSRVPRPDEAVAKIMSVDSAAKIQLRGYMVNSSSSCGSQANIQSFAKKSGLKVNGENQNAPSQR